MNNTVYVIGHKNPDTDSICSAIGYAAFKNAADNTASYIPGRAGSLNPETEFVLNRFGMEEPQFIESAAGKTVILVDHNETAQAADNIADAKIIEILDHHKLGDVQTAEPLYIRMMPVGCTATIVYLHYREAGLTPDKNIAGVLCSAILSDTLAFRSPTCTEQDRAAAEALAELAGIGDVQAYAKEMFKAGSNLLEKTPDEIFHMDYKKFTAGDVTFGVGQVTSMDADELKELKSRMISYMNDTFADHGVDMIFFMLTDILDESDRSYLRRHRSSGSGFESIYFRRRRKNVSERLRFPQKADHSAADRSSLLMERPLPICMLLITGRKNISSSGI